jgi:DNA-binding MarR family transcriptional regulator
MRTAPKDRFPAGSERPQQARLTLSEEHEFFILMHQVIEMITKARENELRPFGISPIQSGVLHVLNAEKGPVAPSQMARSLLRTPSSVHQLLERMEGHKLVKLRRSTKGKRQVKVEETERGRAICRRDLNESGVVQKILRQLLPEERNQLWAILKKLREVANAELSLSPSFP